MKREIRYSLRARFEQLEMLDYIAQNFGIEKAKEIFNKIEKILAQLSINPEMYPQSNRKKGIRRCVFSKQTSIYFRVNSETIEIISFRPNRKTPREPFI